MDLDNCQGYVSRTSIHLWLYPLCEPSALCDRYHDLVGEGCRCCICVYAIYDAGCLLSDGWVGRGNAGNVGRVWCHWERHVGQGNGWSLLETTGSVTWIGNESSIVTNLEGWRDVTRDSRGCGRFSEKLRKVPFALRFNGLYNRAYLSEASCARKRRMKSLREAMAANTLPRP